LHSPIHAPIHPPIHPPIRAHTQLPPILPDDALLGGARGYLPSDPVLLRSEFMHPLTDDQLELYQWLLGRDEGGIGGGGLLGGALR